MCGRFALYADSKDVKDFYKAQSMQSLRSGYNIAPGSDVSAVLYSRKTHQREIHDLFWGFLPNWTPDADKAKKPINARAESIAESPFFKDSFLKRRCIIPANGFFEWDKAHKQPYYISAKGGWFSLAGVWDIWRNGDGEVLASCAIITRDSVSLLQNIHSRMPAILDTDSLDSWLDPNTTVTRALKCLAPYPGAKMNCWPISKKVNAPQNNSKDILEPVTL